jgi:two-component system sensor histidine kinase MtrB
MRGVRARLTATLVALVVLTAAILGIGSYVFVDTRIHEQTRSDAAALARFDLSTTIPDRLTDRTLEGMVSSRLVETFKGRGLETMVDFGDGQEPFVSELSLHPSQLSEALHSAVSGGQLSYEWTTLAGRPALVVGGRLPPAGPDFYFVHDVAALEATLEQLRLALGVGALVLVALALLAARLVARGVLAPVEAASRAAERIELGDFSARVPVTSNDEFGAWAERFNRMAAALEETIGRLRTAQGQNRRFVADVSHELRTPLAALVAEASILRDDLDSLPAGTRRAGELLIGDVARLRTLVDDLMEVSRFDAEAEHFASQSVDLVRVVETVVANRLPEAQLTLPSGPVTLETDPRRLERIIGNLLDNAREHAPGSPVEVSLVAADEELTIAIEDRGPGVEPDRLDRIFERFYKADPSRHGGSSGLGLAIAAEHATLLGGELRASNRPGGGLRMELRLPVTGSLRAGDPSATGRVDGGSEPLPQEDPLR